jgi:hypothetical protein
LTENGTESEGIRITLIGDFSTHDVMFGGVLPDEFTPPKEFDGRYEVSVVVEREGGENVAYWAGGANYA